MKKIRNLYNFLNHYSSILIDNMKNNVAYSLIAISIILSILFCDKFTFFIFAIIVYILYLKKEKFEFEKRNFAVQKRQVYKNIITTYIIEAILPPPFHNIGKYYTRRVNPPLFLCSYYAHILFINNQNNQSYEFVFVVLIS